MPPFNKFQVKRGKKGAGSDPTALLGKLCGLICCEVPKVPIKNEIGPSETIFWLMFFYFFIGTLYYIGVEGWSTVDSVYFLVVTMTTVGYGDVKPSPANRPVTIFFVIWAIIVSMTGLNALAGYLLDLRDSMVARTQAAMIKAAASGQGREVDSKGDPRPRGKSLFDGGQGDSAQLLVNDQDSNASDAKAGGKAGGKGGVQGGSPKKKLSSGGSGSFPGSALGLDDDDIAARVEEIKNRHSKASFSFAAHAQQVRSSWSGPAGTGPPAWRLWLSYLASLPGLVLKRYPILGVIWWLAAYAVCFGALFAHVEEMTWIDAVYYCTLTGTTIGYGDVTPRTEGGRWLACLFVPFAVFYVSAQLSAISQILIGNSTDSKLEAFLKMDLSLEALLAMDEDGDGEIDEYEFIRFMLVSADMASAELLDSLHARFQAMDEDGSGFLSADDIPRKEPHPPDPGAQKEAGAPSLFSPGLVAAGEAAWRQGQLSVFGATAGTAAKGGKGGGGASAREECVHLTRELAAHWAELGGPPKRRKRKSKGASKATPTASALRKQPPPGAPPPPPPDEFGSAKRTTFLAEPPATTLMIKTTGSPLEAKKKRAAAEAQRRRVYSNENMSIISGRASAEDWAGTPPHEGQGAKSPLTAGVANRRSGGESTSSTERTDPSEAATEQSGATSIVEPKKGGGGTVSASKPRTPKKKPAPRMRGASPQREERYETN